EVMDALNHALDKFPRDRQSRDEGPAEIFREDGDYFLQELTGQGRLVEHHRELFQAAKYGLEVDACRELAERLAELLDDAVEAQHLSQVDLAELCVDGIGQRLRAVFQLH